MRTRNSDFFFSELWDINTQFWLFLKTVGYKLVIVRKKVWLRDTNSWLFSYKCEFVSRTSDFFLAIPIYISQFWHFLRVIKPNSEGGGTDWYVLGIARLYLTSLTWLAIACNSEKKSQNCEIYDFFFFKSELWDLRFFFFLKSQNCELVYILQLW